MLSILSTSAEDEGAAGREDMGQYWEGKATAWPDLFQIAVLYASKWKLQFFSDIHKSC
jgi:hypothetical protein